MGRILILRHSARLVEIEKAQLLFSFELLCFDFFVFICLEVLCLGACTMLDALQHRTVVVVIRNEQAGIVICLFSKDD